MMRNWLAVALLSASWMWGLEYYTASNGWLWAIALIAGGLLLAESPRRLPCRTNAAIAALLALPTLWLLPWPHGAIPLALVLGLLPLIFPNAPQRICSLGWGAVQAAVILAGQAIVLRAYALLTARCHDLPWPGPSLVAIMARLLGADASADGAEVAIFSTSGLQRLGATWELVLDPVTLGLLAGAVLLVTLWNWEDRTPTGLSGIRHWALPWLADLGYVSLAIGLWIPIRLGLLLGLFLHREMRAPEELKLTVMNQFFSPWVLVGMSLGAVASLAYWVRRRPPESLGARAEPTSEVSNWRELGIAALTTVVLAAAATALLVLEPVGKPKGGRVVFVERHSEWEPTDRAYDTESFGHDPSYSYTAIYNYCQQYFDVSRLTEDEPIDAARLGDCDVLVIKTPTQPYSPEELRAVHRFVARGGGLLLVGEHTDFMRMGTCLNQIASPFGFKFRPDNLFAVDEPYIQHVAPRRFPHPSVRNVPFIRYAGSCSIDPGWSWGRAAVWNTGLWGLSADYNMDNFFPEAYYRPEMRYGAFIQLWETRHGKGRILAFTDSTIFSNFSTFEPGKAEFMLDMLSWLNCRSALDSAGVRILVRLCGWCVAAALVWLVLARFPRFGGAWIVVASAGLLGYLGATTGIATWQRGGLPDCQRPLVRVVVDRGTSHVPLSEGGYTDEPEGYGLLEQWIPRLGHYTVRADGPEAFSGDVLLVVSPTVSVSEEYRRRLVEWVSEGGKLVVIDSPDRFGTTANSLLWPFGIALYYATASQGELRLEDSDWPGISVATACQIEGGDPFMWVGETPVAARARYGEGTVTAIGFGALMNNESMGTMWVAEPGPAELKVYSLLFELIESVVEDRPVRAPPVEPPNEASSVGDSDAIGTIRSEGESP
jgi:uncharacterized protein DUF4350